MFLVKRLVHHGEDKIEMTVSKAKTTKAKTVKATAAKAPVTEPSSPAVEHVVSNVTITPEAAVPAVVTPVVTTLAAAPAVTAVAVVTPQQVAQRAYEIWQSAAHVHGNDVEHWLAAELELKQLVKH